jgi:hypothetical protein
MARGRSGQSGHALRAKTGRSRLTLEISSAKHAAAVISAVLAAVAKGDITPGEAGEVSKIVEAYCSRLGWPL